MRKINEHENLVFWELFVSIKVVNHTHSLKQKMGFMTDSTLCYYPQTQSSQAIT